MWHLKPEVHFDKNSSCRDSLFNFKGNIRKHALKVKFGAGHRKLFPENNGIIMQKNNEVI